MIDALKIITILNEKGIEATPDTLINAIIEVLIFDRANRLDAVVMPKIADNWLNHKCINNACWFHGLNDKNCGNPEFENETIAGCAPRTQHKMMLNGIVGKEKADKISNESNFAI